MLSTSFPSQSSPGTSNAIRLQLLKTRVTPSVFGPHPTSTHEYRFRHVFEQLDGFAIRGSSSETRIILIVIQWSFMPLSYHEATKVDQTSVRGTRDKHVRDVATSDNGSRSRSKSRTLYVFGARSLCPLNRASGTTSKSLSLHGG